MQTKTVRTFRLASRQKTGGSVKFDDVTTATANTMEEAVRMYCQTRSMVHPVKYGNWLWVAKKAGVEYLIRCDSTAQGRERAAGA